MVLIVIIIIFIIIRRKICVAKLNMAVPHGSGIDVRFDEQLSTPQRLRLEVNKWVAVNKLIRKKEKKKDLVVRCCKCGSAGTCKRCSCVKDSKRCMNCCPWENGKCENKGIPLSLNAQNNEEILEADTEVNSKMMRAISSEWHSRWEIIASTHNSQYILPSGAVSKEFLRVLAEEIRNVESGKEISERMLVFAPMMLQKDSVGMLRG